ncbi:MAG: 16S rRNA (cytidine(1402)-2'-O)-methyltransferase [Epulopiscium sp. Nuni2H_MBin003]|nr:MAG: 16S rRNA (cytidine(1402)-2'-O)-methyltransferase [Epulopiscium sp. Nuni2H_MBin003]
MQYGTLTLCATPIGNLDDITLRTIKVLQNVDYILAEDTRHTRKLLNHLNIDKKLVSYHEHNKIEKGKSIIEHLKSGTNIALVTDAGTPGISDPGEDLVKLCLAEDIVVTSTPGAAAFVTALILSGKCTRRFIFEGFLPTDKKQKNTVLSSIENDCRTLIFYEAPHRLTKTLTTLYEILGDREISIIKELTKKHETIINTTIAQAIKSYNQNPAKGEFVLVIAGKDAAELRQQQIMEWDKVSIEEHVSMYIEKGATQKEAMKLVAKDRGVTKRDIYAKIKL